MIILLIEGILVVVDLLILFSDRMQLGGANELFMRDLCRYSTKMLNYLFEFSFPLHIPACSLPYRMVYAVASLNAILFYDTQHLAPFAYVSDIHYASITDIAWCVV